MGRPWLPIDAFMVSSNGDASPSVRTLSPGPSGSGSMVPMSVVSGRGSALDFSTCPGRSGALAQSGVTQTLTYTFLCPKCKREVPIVEGEQRGAQTWCKKDVGSYKALAQRWSQNRALRDWWTKLPAAEQTSWFLKWQQVAAGSKRRFEECFGEEKSREASYVDNGAVDEWLPIREWMAYRRQENPFLEITEEDLFEEFAEIVRNNRVSCLWQRKQWHVPVYRGIKRQAGVRDSHEVTAGARRKIGSEADLREHLDQGRASLDAFNKSVVAVPNLSEQVPVIDASEADQAPLAAVISQCGPLINREVTYEVLWCHCFFKKVIFCIVFDFQEKMHVLACPGMSW